MRAQWLTLLLMATSLCGCGTSRWAMNDPDYARKYDAPYNDDQVDKVGRMAKQAVDARHVKHKSGVYAAAAAQGDPTAVGAQIGAFTYGASWLSAHAGLAGLVGTEEDVWCAGLDAGLRAQSPSRLSPFAGVGTFLGARPELVSAEHDGIDNDDDGSIDELGEYDWDLEDMTAAVYPELGVHFWLDGRRRLTLSGAYYVTDNGRDSDFWFFGIGYGVLAAR